MVLVYWPRMVSLAQPLDHHHDTLDIRHQTNEHTETKQNKASCGLQATLSWNFHVVNHSSVCHNAGFSENKHRRASFRESPSTIAIRNCISLKLVHRIQRDSPNSNTPHFSAYMSGFLRGAGAQSKLFSPVVGMGWGCELEWGLVCYVGRQRSSAQTAMTRQRHQLVNRNSMLERCQRLGQDVLKAVKERNLGELGRDVITTAEQDRPPEKENQAPRC